MRRPRVGLPLPLLPGYLVPLEVHVPVHEATEVLLDKRVPEGSVVDGVDHGGNDNLKRGKYKKIIFVRKMRYTIITIRI